MIRVLSKQYPRQSVGMVIGETLSSCRKLSNGSTIAMNRVGRYHKFQPTNTNYYYYFDTTGTSNVRPLAAAATSTSAVDFGRCRTLFTSSGSDNENENGTDSNKNKKDAETKTDDNDDGSSDSLTPTILPFGESAPRLPHVMALPLVSRPLFPGLITAVTLTDPATIRAFEELNTKGNSYLSCFLRAKYSSGVISETGTVLSTPELITDISDLHPVGTFVQIQRITRDLQNSKKTDVSSALSSSTSAYDKDDKSSSTATLILLAHRRVDLLSVDSIGPPIDVTVKHWSPMEYTGTGSTDTIRALRNEIISVIREVSQMNSLFRENLQLFPIKLDVNDPYRLADFAASISSSGTPEDLQDVLSERNPEARLHKALALLIKEREVSKLQEEISRRVNERMSEEQRTHFLKEQLKSIKKELGMERDDKDTVIEKYRNKIKSYPQPLPPDASAAIEAELDKISNFGMQHSDITTIRSYLDWLTSIPWNVMTPENYNISAARKALDHDHYGIDDVKTAILQFVAVGKLKQQQKQQQQQQQQQGVNTAIDETTGSEEISESSNDTTKVDPSVTSGTGKILCLAGPPGTGKTSIASSIANALGRKFYRFSVGGLSDVSEIKGHRRTYVGAMPGQIIQCLKTTGSFNAVCLIDEIDKLSTGYRGDPASALLEVLDPSQNSTFRDHFIDFPVDISKILFICTANEVERIPAPLLDRMDVIRLSGYDFPEKITIAEKYLVPKAMRDNGLMVDPASSSASPSTSSDSGTDSINAESPAMKQPTPFDQYVPADGVPSSTSITREAITSLVRGYAREAGVRSLAKYIDKITRKLALQIVAESEGTDLTEKEKRKTDAWVINDSNLVEYVGIPRFTSDRLYENGPLPSGIVTGLAYTSMGGATLYIETQGIKRGLDENGKTRGGGTFLVTGQLGDVMKESAQISYTVARARLSSIQPENSTFDTTDIHLHVPAGATPKDGPSAGVTMVTSMLSLALDKSIRNDIAMTGEISLTGKVMPVGGIKEKIMAARRDGITNVLLPESNRSDYDEIPEYLKDGLTVHYADHYDKVYDVMFV